MGRDGREFVESDLSTREAEAIEPSHHGLGQEQENVIKISCGVRRNAAEIGSVLRVSPMREICGSPMARMSLPAYP